MWRRFIQRALDWFAEQHTASWQAFCRHIRREQFRALQIQAAQTHQERLLEAFWRGFYNWRRFGENSLQEQCRSRGGA